MSFEYDPARPILDAIYDAQVAVQERRCNRIKAEGYREAYEKLRLTWIAETDYDCGRMAMLDDLLALAEELEKS